MVVDQWDQALSAAAAVATRRRTLVCRQGSLKAGVQRMASCAEARPAAGDQPEAMASFTRLLAAVDERHVLSEHYGAASVGTGVRDGIMH